MKPEDPSTQPTLFGGALDVALAKALRPPVVPADFRFRLHAALARADDEHETESAHARLERERRAGLAELESGYLRLRRSTLGALIGASFAAGTGLALLLPWLKATFGADAMLAIAALGGCAGLAIGLASCCARFAGVRPLERFR